MSVSTSDLKPEETLIAEARERIRRIGRPIQSTSALYGPGPGPDDPEDLEAFLAFLDEQRQPVRVPSEPEEA
jgi:hypothetical protein